MRYRLQRNGGDSPARGAFVSGDWQLCDLARDAYRFRFVEETLPALIRKHRPEFLLCLGDLTEEKDRHPAALVNRISDGVSALADLVPVVILTGNHDFDMDSTNPFFRFLRRSKNVAWIQRPTSTDDGPPPLPALGDAIGPALFLPYTRDYEKDWSEVQRSFNRYEWIFAHNTFDGSDAGLGYTLRGIPPSIFPKHVRVIAGDVHKPQVVGPVTYSGAPYLVDFGDQYNPRLLHIERGGRMNSIDIPGPQKILIEVEVGEWQSVVAKLDLRKGDILKIRVALKPAQYEHWNAIKAEIHEWGEKQGYVVYLVQPMVEKGRLPAQRQDTRKVDDEELIRRYVTSQGWGEAALQAGLNLLEIT